MVLYARTAPHITPGSPGSVAGEEGARDCNAPPLTGLQHQGLRASSDLGGCSRGDLERLNGNHRNVHTFPHLGVILRKSGRKQ